MNRPALALIDVAAVVAFLSLTLATFALADGPHVAIRVVTATPTASSTPSPTATATATPTPTPTPSPTPAPAVVIPDVFATARAIALLPAPTIAPQVAAAEVAPAVAPVYLTLEQLDQAAAAAGWQLPEWLYMRRIISECENPALNATAHNRSDPAGGSYGLAQLNGRYWFDRYGEDFAQRFDPVVNLRTALKLYQERGRFGGGGGWSCAGHLGIP